MIIDMEDLSVAYGQMFWMAEAIDRISPLDTWSFVLEAGCGSGKMGINLAARHGCHVTLIDNDHEALAKAERLKAAVGGAKGWDVSVTIRWADLSRLPFEENTFQLVFNEGVIEHFRNPVLPLKEMIRVSRRDVMVVVPNMENPLQKLLAQRQTKQYEGRKHWAAYEQPMTADQLGRHMIDAGLKHVSIAHAWLDGSYPNPEPRHYRMVIGAGKK